MTKIKDAEKAFLTKIQVLYDVEKQLEKSLPKMAKASTHPDLKKGFTMHLKETREHSKRLEKIFNIFNTKPKKTKSEGIRGIIADADWVTKINAPNETRDVMLASSARYAEHYEMAGYMSAILEAEILKMPDVAKILSETLEEEESCDASLAMGMEINLKMITNSN